LKNRIDALSKSRQEELNRLSAAHNQVVDELKAQIEFYKQDSERLKGHYEAQKKTLETDMAELVRSVHLLAGGSARPESSN
jgi:chromosome segregation ATPase